MLLTPGFAIVSEAGSAGALWSPGLLIDDSSQGEPGCSICSSSARLRMQTCSPMAAPPHRCALVEEARLLSASHVMPCMLLAVDSHEAHICLSVHAVCRVASSDAASHASPCTSKNQHSSAHRHARLQH